VRTLLACPASGGGRPLDRFVAELGDEAEVNLTATLELLLAVERRYWLRPQFDVLHGKKYRGMGELRFDGDGKTYRIFGYFGPNRLQFTLLLGCEKKRDLKHEMDLAAKRRDFAEANQRLLYEFTVETGFVGQIGEQEIP
jgi:hypothetical protein